VWRDRKHNIKNAGIMRKILRRNYSYWLAASGIAPQHQVAMTPVPTTRRGEGLLKEPRLPATKNSRQLG
jgi:hypothetical protein